MLEQQSQRSLLPETLKVLAQLGIKPPAISRVFVPVHWPRPNGTTPDRETVPLVLPDQAVVTPGPK